MDLHSRPQVPILNRFMDGYGRDLNKLIPTPSRSAVSISSFPWNGRDLLAFPCLGIGARIGRGVAITG
jgi:hypothetical protein